MKALNGLDVFGPILNLRAYDPATGSYQLSALVVCSESAQQRLKITAPQLSWWDPDCGLGCPVHGRNSPDAASSSEDSPQQAPQQQQGQAPAPPLPQPQSQEQQEATAALQQPQLEQQTLPDGAGQAVAEALQGSGMSGPEPQKSAVLHSAPGELLYTWRDWSFWRFSFGSTCGKATKQLRYQVNLLPDQTFCVELPSRDQSWHWAYYSCNGLDTPANAAKTGGVQPLWSDLMAVHANKPLHALVGGGDQLYNDGVFNGPLLKGWDRTLSDVDTAAKVALPFSDSMRQEVEEFYFSHYCVHWDQPVLRTALASIPSLNIWDDHDIFDGWGSYPDRMLQSPVLQGIFQTARLFYHLFQLHTTPGTARQDGFWCGTSSLTFLGSSTAVVLADTRSFRTIQQICPPEFYSELAARLEALPGHVRHVVVVLTVPMMWPKLQVTKLLQKASSKITRDRALNHVLGVTGVLPHLQLRFGEIEIIDDLLDQWDADPHRAESEALLGMLMDLAARKGFRVTLLSGDVHCGGYAVCHSRNGVPASEVECMWLPGDEALAADPRFITQVVSSAITNVPPPPFVIEALEEAGRRPKPILQDCVMRMRKPIQHRKPSVGPSLGPWRECTDDFLLAARNWCEVSQPDGPDGELLFGLRCERKLGRGQVNSYQIRVPPLEQ